MSVPSMVADAGTTAFLVLAGILAAVGLTGALVQRSVPALAVGLQVALAAASVGLLGATLGSGDRAGSSLALVIAVTAPAQLLLLVAITAVLRRRTGAADVDGRDEGED